MNFGLGHMTHILQLIRIWFIIYYPPPLRFRTSALPFTRLLWKRLQTAAGMARQVCCHTLLWAVTVCVGPLLQPRLQEDVRPKDKCRNYQMCYLSSRKECFIRYACVLLGMLTQRRFKMLQERFYRYPLRISMGLSVGLELVFHFFFWCWSLL